MLPVHPLKVTIKKVNILANLEKIPHSVLRDHICKNEMNVSTKGQSPLVATITGTDEGKKDKNYVQCSKLWKQKILAVK